MDTASDQPTDHDSPPATDLRMYVIIGIGALLFLGLASLLLSQQARAVSRVKIEPAPADLREPREPTDVLEVARAMKLVTVVVTATVDSQAQSNTWRGDARAEVAAPVTFMYGVDLSELPADALAHNDLTGTYTLTIPTPRRIAVQVDASEAEEQIEVTGTRTRGRAGNYLLTLAHKKLYDEAFAKPLPAETREQVDRLTVEQVEKMVRLFLADDDARVVVRIERPGGFIGSLLDES